jgi:hypothetical protein
VADAPGLTVEQLVAIIREDVPHNRIADVLQRIPAKFFDRGLGLYRPVAAAIAVALDYSGDCCPGCDERLAEDVEIIATDPTPDPGAWLIVADRPFEIGRLLQNVGTRMARLYATPKRRSSKKPSPAPR